MLLVSLSRFLSYLSNRRAHNPLSGGTIQIKLANSSPVLLRLVVVDHLTVFEDALSDLHAIKKAAFSIGLVDHPCSFVKSAVIPVHFPVPVPQIGMIVAFIYISVIPGINPVALLPILHELALIFFIRIPLSPHSVTILLTIHKLALVKTVVVPVVFPKTMEFSIIIVALVEVSCHKFLCTFSMLDKGHECPLVSTRVIFSEHPETRGRSLFPLAQVRVTLRTDPQASSVFEIILPLSVVGLSVRVTVLSLPMHFVLPILALKDTPIGKDLIGLSISLVIEPIPIVTLARMVEHDALTIPLSTLKLPVVDCLLVLLQL